MSKCPACGQNRNHVYYESTDWHVAECKVCGFARVVDTEEAPSRGAFGWGDDIMRESQRRRRMYLDRMRRIEKYQPVPKLWLDVGCGGGGILRWASDYGWQVEGVEPGPVAALVTSRLGFPVYQSCLAEALSHLTSREYGVVSYFHVLEHVFDPRAEVLLAREICSPSGVLVIEVPLFGSLAWKIQRTRHRHFYRGHRSYFTMKALSALLTRAGFDVIECTRVPYLASVGWVCMRLKLPQRIIERLPSSVLELPVRIDLADVFMTIAKRR